MRQAYKIIIIIVMILASSSFFTAFSQKKDSYFIGTVNGYVQDSVHNYVLRSATLAIYNANDTSLVSYQLSNNFGEFHFHNLPVGIPLKIIASFVGYKSSGKLFILSAKEPEINLKNLNLERGETVLSKVIVTAIPPVRVNKDTLEFNAAAFKLDQNAVVEDLLRKLPGVTVWGDGTITINGKKVSEVLVDGKAFFGSNPRIALQNIPKGAINKIQVYKKQRDERNPFDSTSAMNIKLKADKKFGHFGKFAVGYGTHQNYESDAVINFFSPRTQWGIVGANNNINKIAVNVSQLMLNSTFKGVGAGIDYQPDFSIGGTNNNLSAGVTYQHDFIENTGNQKKELNGEYFFARRNNKTLYDAETITSTGGDSTITYKNNSNNKSSSLVHNFSSGYNFRNSRIDISILPSITLSSNDNSESSKQSSTSSTQGLQSTNNIENAGHSENDLFSLKTMLTRHKPFGNYNRPGDWLIEYKIDLQHDNEDNTLTSDFISFINPAQNKQLIRNYNIRNDNTGQYLDAQIGDFSNWLFGGGNFMSTIEIRLQNKISFNTQNQTRLVRDKDFASDSFISNPYLTNHNKYININDQPSVNFSRTFVNGLANRYQKTFRINAEARAQIYRQKNTSSHTFQNFSRNYQQFVPFLSLNYKNNQYGYYENSFDLNYSVVAAYANVNLLYPLVDSSNLYFIQEGNPNLKPSVKRQIGFTFQHSSNRIKNFNYFLGIYTGITDSYFADSSIINSSGQYRHFTINMDGYKYLNLTGTLNKAFKLASSSTLQLVIKSSLNFSRTPNYILNNGTNKSALNISKNANTVSNLTLSYSYKDILAVNLSQNVSYYNSRQDGLSNISFHNNARSSIVSASVNCTRRLNVSSNITYNSNVFTGSGTTNFTVWNANASYRFMRGNNLELKFSALDLLNQNKSIINSGDNYSVTHTFVNVLQQYFMFTITYFPRKFGKKKE